MKKTSILLIALALVMLFASSAFASQASYIDPVTKMVYYSSTTVSTISQTYSVVSDNANVTRLNPNRKFSSVNNVTYYPYEIYLPNESEPYKYRIHSNYSKDTDACASCHSTHTAVGPSLLQWYSVYETCIACHDGTVTTTYNVVNGKIGEFDKPTYGGMFGMGSELDLSNHNVNGAVQIAAAPGGSVEGKTISRGFNSVTMWQTTFGCESCHTPHGQGGNARILSPDPNGYATDKSINNALSLTVDNSTGAIKNAGVATPIITGYPYKPVIYGTADQSDDITSDFIIKNDGKPDTNSVMVGAYSYVVARATATHTIAQINHIEKAVIPFSVRMQITDYLKTTEAVKHVYGINAFCGACHVDYNTEPYVETGNGGNGIDTIMGVNTNRPGYGAEAGEFSKAHRHAVGLKWNYANAADAGYIGNNKLMLTTGYVTGTENGSSGSPSGVNATYISCLTCHFAHGTSQDFWKTWLNKYSLYDPTGNESTLWNPSEVNELVGSSALKRLPNMGTCEACHQKGVDAQGYATNTDQTLVVTTTTGDGIFTLGNYANKTINNATCETSGCHKGMQTNYQATNMGNGAGVAAILCEKCHIAVGGPAGSSGNHAIQPSAKNIINTRNLPIADQNALCLQSGCHVDSVPDNSTGGTYELKGQWLSSNNSHLKSGVISCTTCHAVHSKNTEGKTLKREYNALCASCHDTTYTFDPATYHGDGL